MAPIQFGVLLVPFQLTDSTGPLDVISCSMKSYLSMMVGDLGVPQSIADRGSDVEFHYINDTMSPSEHTCGAKLVPSCTFDDCPKLDYLLVGGPMPEFFMSMSPRWVEFIRKQCDEVEGVFATCTGAMVLAMTGVLDGKNATVNHQFVPAAMKMAPGVKWTKEVQWVVDGKFWTSGGACAGMDMFAQWTSHKVGRDVAEIGWAALDFEPRDVHGKLLKLDYGLRVLPN